MPQRLEQGSSGSNGISVERHGNVLTLSNSTPIGDCWPSMPAVMVRWAARTPEAPFLCERGADGGWQRKTYARVRRAI